VFDLASDHSCCQLLSTECGRRNLLLTIIVRWVNNTFGMTAPKLMMIISVPTSYRSCDMLVCLVTWKATRNLVKIWFWWSDEHFLQWNQCKTVVAAKWLLCRIPQSIISQTHKRVELVVCTFHWPQTARNTRGSVQKTIFWKPS